MSPDILGPHSGLVVGARALLRSRERRDQQLFLVEGPQAVREAIVAGYVQQLFVDHTRNEALSEFRETGIRTAAVTAKAIDALTETEQPQGVVAVCAMPRRSIDDVLAASPSLIAVAVEINDPGNLGTIIRTADAAGADAVLVTDGSADIYNGKVIRSSVGSLFHLPVVQGLDAHATLAAIRSAHIRSLGLAGLGAVSLFDLDDTDLQLPTAWWLGSEAHGLDPQLVAELDAAVAIPMQGSAESLNVATAGAIALFTSARARAH